MAKELAITTVYIEEGEKRYVFNDGVTAIYKQDAWRDQQGDILHNEYTARIKIDNGLCVDQCLKWINILTIEPTKANMVKIRFYVLCLRLLLSKEQILYY